MIGINQLALRQTHTSRFSHFAGEWEELVSMVEANFAAATPGYRHGVVLVPLQPERFFSGVVELGPETELRASFDTRRKGEEPYLQVVAVGGEKAPAAFVEAVLYRHDVLGADASTEEAWEIVSLNARPTPEPEPLTPVAMARNFLSLPGGTSAEYTAEEFAHAIIYWSRRAMRG